MFHAKRSLALVAAVCMTAALGTGCGKKSEPARPGQAKVAVNTDAIIGDITSVKLIILGEPGSAPGSAGFPIETTLSKAAANNVWTGNVTNIPANGTGVNRTFIAQAFNGATKTYEGQTIATVIAGQTAQVTIILQELNVTPGPTNYAPVISSITSTAAYVLPTQTGKFTVTAYDPDDSAHFNRPQFNGSPLGFVWGASCTNGATLTLGTPVSTGNASEISFTAPNVPSTRCTVSIKVSETTLANNTSVTTYFTLDVNGNFGDADVFAFPNTAPIITVRGDFRYNFFAEVLTIPVGQQGDLVFAATDADGDNVRFDLSGRCGTGFDPTDGQIVNATAIANNQFSAFTFTTNTGGPVSPPTPKTYSWNPTFGYPAPVVPFTDPAKSCSFKLVVSDLCTANNCGPTGSQGARANGADRGGVTTGFLNATAPSQPRRAPSIVRVTVPNQLGAAIAPPTFPAPQTWEPKKFVQIQPNGVYTLTIEGNDEYEPGPLTATWGCNEGTGQGTVVTTPTPKTIKNELTWKAPASLVLDMSCVATITSTASGLSTVATVRFAGSDPCVGQPNGTACSDGNACTVGETCQAGSCTVPAGSFTVNNGATAPTTGVTGTATCVAASACRVNGLCAPNTGACTDPNASNGVSCNADSNGCTQNDTCQAGACVAGPAPACNTPPNAFCYAAGSGACASTGTNTFACNYTAAVGQTCSVANAAAKCSGTNQFTSFACDSGGACVGSGSAVCANTTCASGNTCQAASGSCGGGVFASAGTTCDDGNTCSTGDNCNGAGACVPTNPGCVNGQVCGPTGCQATKVVPQVARGLRIVPPAAIAMNTTGDTFVAGSFNRNVATDFQTAVGQPPILLTSTGGNDIFLGRYNTSGNVVYALNIGVDDPLAEPGAVDQTATTVAVNGAGSLAFAGRSTGTLTFGATNISTSAPTPYVAAVSAANPATRLFIKRFGLGTNGNFRSVAGNPNLTGAAGDRIAVCGLANAAATQLIPGVTFQGGTDLILAVFDSTGAVTWARQLGGAGTNTNETCGAAAVDDSGNVVATGVFDGASLTFPGATPITLTGPGSAAQKYVWVARFDGATGAVLAARAFLATSISNPTSIAVRPDGSLLLGGTYAGDINLTGTLFTSLGSDDAFVAVLNGSTLAPVTAVSFGSSNLDRLNGLASTGFGDALSIGTFTGNLLGTGININSNGLAASDIFVAKLNELTLAGESANAYGDGVTQNGDAIVANRFSGNRVSFATTVVGSADFGGGVTISAVGAQDVVIVFGATQ